MTPLRPASFRLAAFEDRRKAFEDDAGVAGTEVAEVLTCAR
jgi:hypothetical protein